MLTPDYLKGLPDELVNYFYELEDFLIEDIARRIKKTGTATSTAEIQRIIAMSIKEGTEEVNAKIGELLEKSAEEISRIFEESERVAVSNQLEIAESKGIDLPTGFAKKVAEAAIENARGELENLTKTMGTISDNGQFTLLTDSYRHALGSEALKAAIGAEDYNSAIRRVLRQFTGNGICVEFPSGRHMTIEASVRQNILSGVKGMASAIMEKNADELGTDGWEVSAHVDCAPDHEGVQGRQFSNKEYEKLNNTLSRPISTLNCRHTAYPIILGISEPVYSESELQEMAKQNADGITYEGKHYSLYEADQMQRKIERSIRKTKRELLAADSAGLKEDFTLKAIKLRRLRDYYADFSDKAGLLPRNELLQVNGYNHSISGKVLYTERQYKKNVRGISKNTQREMPNGLRASRFHKLTEEEIKMIKNDIKEIQADSRVFRINEGDTTGYSDISGVIYVRGNVMPDLNSNNPRDIMSSRAVLAHEYYGHYANRGTKLEAGDWRDEFRASYMAAKNAPNLENIDRQYLIRDAIMRAAEAGVVIKLNQFMREILYGYEV